MRLLSAEAIEATILHMLGVPYKEIADIFQLSPNTIKYHTFQVKKFYPQLEQFFFNNVSTVPESLDEKIQLAKELTMQFTNTQKPTEQPDTSTISTSTISTINPQPEKQLQPQIQLQSPELLLQAIDRSVSTYYQTPLDAKEYEEDEKEEKEEHKNTENKKDIYLYITLAVVIILTIVILNSSKPSEKTKYIPMPPSTKPNVIRLSRMGVF